MLGVRHIAFWRTVALAFALVAIGVRASVPVGFMPAATPSGLIAITLCGGDGPLLLNPQTGELKHGDDSNHRSESRTHAPCVFAGAPAAAPAPVAQTIAAPIIVALDTPTLSVSVHVGAGLAAPPPPARGPPSDLI